MTTADRLRAAFQLLDDERRHLDKAPFLPTHEQVNEIAQLVAAVKDMIDEVADALIPHVRRLPADQQADITGGWTIYDRDVASTWPPTNTPIIIRQYHPEPSSRGHGRYQDQRRGEFTGGELRWRVRGDRPLAGVTTPCAGSWVYAWRHQHA